MASKGQKFNKYTIEQKEKILQEYYEGLGGSKALGRKYNISYRTIDTWIRKINHPELKTNSKRGRPKEENIDYKERYEILKKYQAFIEARHKTK
jgi:transposase-like protein